MAHITKMLGIAVADHDRGEISTEQLISIFQEAVDNGDILEPDNCSTVIACIMPLELQGIIRSSPHFERFLKTEAAKAKGWVARSKASMDGSHLGSLTNAQIFAMISERVAEAESAIKSHPAQIATVYETHKRSIPKKAPLVQGPPRSLSSPVREHEFAIVDQMLISWAFVSACCCMAGHNKRHEIAEVPVKHVTGLGFSVEDAMKRFSEFEDVWFNLLRFQSP